MSAYMGVDLKNMSVTANAEAIYRQGFGLFNN
jgi:hypothetical protein